MNSAEPAPYLTEEEYLEGECHSEIKHEYYDGCVTAMAGASDPHELVSMNIAVALANHLRGKGCRVYKSDFKVRLKIRGKPLYYYPDGMVACDPADDHRLYRERPKLLIEVISEDWKRELVEKAFAYRQIESLEEYVVIKPDPDAPEVYIFRRADGWEPPQKLTGMDAEFTLESVGLKLKVADLFAV